MIGRKVDGEKGESRVEGEDNGEDWGGKEGGWDDGMKSRRDGM